MKLQELFPTFSKLFNQGNKQPRYGHTSSTKTSKRRNKYTHSEAFERSELNGLDEDGGLDMEEVYQLDVMTGGDIIPDRYTEAWSDNDYDYD